MFPEARWSRDGQGRGQGRARLGAARRGGEGRVHLGQGIFDQSQFYQNVHTPGLCTVLYITMQDFKHALCTILYEDLYDFERNYT